MKLVRGFLVAGCVLSGAFGQQPQTPPPMADHPEIHSPDRRAELSKLTESLSPDARGTFEPVAHNNYIDEYVFEKIERDGVPHASLASDDTFVRRLYVDLTGRIPTGDEARAFVEDSDPEKRDKLIDKLVGSVDWRDRWTH